jgi:hypothetical protein
MPSNAKSLGFTIVPMLWGPNQANTFSQIVTAGYAQYALGFNEPDQASGADISAQEGVALWLQHIQPLASKGYTLISPAPSQTPTGTQWLKDFVQECGGCTVGL